MPLLVQARRVNRHKEHAQQKLQTYLVRIITHMHSLGITGRIGIDLLVGWMVRLTVSKTHFGLDNSVNLFEEMFCSPETSSC